jgi:hypothetical protein
MSALALVLWAWQAAVRVVNLRRATVSPTKRNQKLLPNNAPWYRSGQLLHLTEDNILRG